MKYTLKYKHVLRYENQSIQSGRLLVMIPNVGNERPIYVTVETPKESP
jgi:hypothetical protein